MGIQGKRSGMVGKVRKGFMERIVFELDSNDGQNFRQQLNMWRNKIW